LQQNQALFLELEENLKNKLKVCQEENYKLQLENQKLASKSEKEASKNDQPVTWLLERASLLAINEQL